MTCQCYQIGGPFIAEDPDCPAHGTEAQRVEREREEELTRLRAEIESMRANDARYRYLRNRSAQAVFTGRRKAAGCWIDCEDENGVLMLVTGDDADAAIDEAMGGRNE